MARLNESFGWDAYYYAAQNVRLQPAQPTPARPGGRDAADLLAGVPFVAEEAAAARTSPPALAARLAAGRRGPGRGHHPPLPGGTPGSGPCTASDGGPSPVRLLVSGLTLDQLRAAVLEELDQTR